MRDATIHTLGDLEGIGTNENTGLKQGYHNQLSSVCPLGCTPGSCRSYEAKGPFKAVEIPLAGM